MHAKVIIADGTAALVGSNNMSQASLSNNREVGVILRETGPLSTVRTRFEGDWTAATPWQ